MDNKKDSIHHVGHSRLDVGRIFRKGFPEVVFGLSKTVEEIEGLLKALEENGQLAVASRVIKDKASKLFKTFPYAKYCERSEVFLSNPSLLPGLLYQTPIGICTGGTSDFGRAEESLKFLEYGGYPVNRYYDIGVAGLKRLLGVLDEINEMDVLLVFAGMEGALPTVLAGLTPVPVIAVPTSVGYGVSEGGTAALNTMLSSCAPGLSVVNIDNGYGAAMMAHAICQKIHQASKGGLVN